MSNRADAIEAYKEGVAYDHDTPVLFVDPELSREEQRAQIKEQLEEHNSGSSKELDIDDLDKILDRVNGMPMVIDDIKVDGSEYSVVSLPDASLDSVKELITTLLEGYGFSEDQIEEAIDNFPGDIEDIMYAIGVHESGHIVQGGERTSTEAAQAHEAKSDKRMIEAVDDKSGSDVAVAIMDILRHLSPGEDIDHSTGALIVKDTSWSTHNVPTGMHFKENMMDAIEKITGEDPKELLEDDPQAFFKAFEEYKAGMIEMALYTYGQDGDRSKLAEVEFEVEHASNFVDAYKRAILDEDVPAREPVNLYELHKEQQVSLNATQSTPVEETPMVSLAQEITQGEEPAIAVLDTEATSIGMADPSRYNPETDHPQAQQLTDTEMTEVMAGMDFSGNISTTGNSEMIQQVAAITPVNADHLPSTNPAAPVMDQNNPFSIPNQPTPSMQA